MKSEDHIIPLPYGHQTLPLDLRLLRNQPTILAAPDLPAEANPAGAILKALERPVGAPPLRDLVRRGDRVAVLCPDLTRPSGAELYMPVLRSVLNSAGVPDKDITILFTLGLHKPNTPEEKRRIVGDEVASRITMVDNDARDEKAHVFMGATSFKNDVLLNRLAVEADKLILTGTIGYHLFAGFGGGRKAVMPGVAFSKTILYNHMLVLTTQVSGWHPRAHASILDGNPAHLDMTEAARMAKPAFLLNTVLNSRHELARVFAGDWLAAFEAGCAFFDQHHAVPVPHKADLVVVSCGGFPKDINFIQSHKTIDYAMHVLRDGGVMIVLAECPAGLGNETFLDWFRYPTAAEFERGLKASYLQVRGGMNAQTAYSLFCKAQKATIVLVSRLPEDAVRKMGLTPAPSLDAALKTANDRLGGDFRAHVIPAGGYHRFFVA
jgi:nickel-dependent lactate racemase